MSTVGSYVTHVRPPLEAEDPEHWLIPFAGDKVRHLLVVLPDDPELISFFGCLSQEHSCMLTVRPFPFVLDDACLLSFSVTHSWHYRGRELLSSGDSAAAYSSNHFAAHFQGQIKAFAVFDCI